MAFPSQFIDELLARNDIVDVVSEHVSLTKKGSSLWGCCPFHNEKTASFHVRPDAQMYKCFGCGKGGGVINFVMEVENMSYPEAIAYLAKRAGMQMPEDNAVNEALQKRKKRLLELNVEAARYYNRMLMSPAGKIGYDYLTGRGLSKATITNFGLGFAPDGWDNLLKAMTQKGFEKGELLDAGLAVSSEKGHIYDKFRNRVMYPIINLNGEVIGFGGRVLDDSKPKYMNSPDTPVYDKSRNMFALNIAKKTKQSYMILTEGYMDTISLHQAGLDNAVASLGTSLTQEHAKLLSRFTKEVVISYDGDAAGINAAQRAIPILEKTGMKVKVLRVTGAKDPDEFIKKFGREKFEKLINQSENHIEYRLEQIRREYNLEDDAQRVDYLKEAAKMLATLPNPVEREIYGNRVAEQTKVSQESMKELIAKVRKLLAKKQEKKETREILTPAQQVQPSDRELKYRDVHSAKAEEGVLKLLMVDPATVTSSSLEGKMFSSELLGKVYDLLKARFLNGQTVSAAALAADLSGPEMNLIAKITCDQQSTGNMTQALSDYIKIIDESYQKRNAASETDLLKLAQKHKLEQMK